MKRVLGRIVDRFTQFDNFDRKCSSHVEKLFLKEETSQYEKVVVQIY